MPIYTYLCKKCDNRFELLVGMTMQSEELKCTKCGSVKIEKTLSSFSVGSSSSSEVECAPSTCHSCPSMSKCPNAGF